MCTPAQCTGRIMLVHVYTLGPCYAIHPAQKLIVTSHEQSYGSAPGFQNTCMCACICICTFFVHIFVCSMYLHCAVFSCSNCGWYRSRATCRLFVVSFPSNTQNTQVFCTEFGLSTLQSWKTTFTVSAPLSPPIFTQTSLSGIRPLCHVSRLALRLHVHVYYYYNVLYSVCFDVYCYLSFWSNS